MNSDLFANQILLNLAAALKRDAITHVASFPKDIGEDYDYFDSLTSKLTGWNKSQYGYALMFWDGWIDNSTHDWRHCPELTFDQWPEIAVQIAVSLEQGQSYSDELLRKMKYVWEE